MEMEIGEVWSETDKSKSLKNKLKVGSSGKALA
jgi:hypothetical protein